MSTSIYVVTHKYFNEKKIHLDNCYKVIAVGDKSKEIYQKIHSFVDCKGNNIAYKNKEYCELTAQYWYWKNDTSSCVIGLCHYRRFFTKYSFSTSYKGILSEADIKRYLSKYDVIVPQKEYSYRGVYRAYLDCGYEKDLSILEEVIYEKFPEYIPEYNQYFKYSAGNFPANMYITTKKISDKYCEWLFSVLHEVEERLDLSNYSVQESRVFGYMSERLLGVWLYHNNLKIKQVRIINTEQKKNIKFYLLEIAKRIKVYQGTKILFWRLRKRGK